MLNDRGHSAIHRPAVVGQPVETPGQVSWKVLAPRCWCPRSWNPAPRSLGPTGRWRVFWPGKNHGKKRIFGNVWFVGSPISGSLHVARSLLGISVGFDVVSMNVVSVGFYVICILATEGFADRSILEGPVLLNLVVLYGSIPTAICKDYLFIGQSWCHWTQNLGWVKTLKFPPHSCF